MNDYYAIAPTFQNKAILKSQGFCGCSYCLESFPVEDIKSWVDKDETAICPHCEIDAVVPLNSEETKEKRTAILEALYKKNFGRSFC